MDYCVFQYGHDDDLMVAIQHLLAVCNQDLFQPVEWFRWRYEQNPWGKAIIVCAQENGRIQAFSVVEKLHVICGSEVCRCGCVTGVAIKEGFEREDILSKLLAVARNRNAKPEDIFEANLKLAKLPKNSS